MNESDRSTRRVRRLQPNDPRLSRIMAVIAAESWSPTQKEEVSFALADACELAEIFGPYNPEGLEDEIPPDEVR